MIRLNIHQAKTHLSRYLAELGANDVIVLCKRNVPIAEIRPLAEISDRKRTIGVAKGEFTIPASFFEPLPADLQDAFDGHG